MSVCTGTRMSPDRKKILAGKFDMQTHSSDLWIYDLEHHIWERASFEASKAEHWGLWSRDGTSIVYAAAPNAHFNLYRIPALPPHKVQPLLVDDQDELPTDFTPDGHLLLYTRLAKDDKGDLWLMPMEGGGEPYPLTETPYDEQDGRFSPDGHWIAYSSDESGTREVYVRSFPRPVRRSRISWGGGRLPQWSLNGRKMYYLTLDGKLMEVSVQPSSSSFKAGTPRFQFDLPGDYSDYAVLPGEKFLVNRQLNPSQGPLTVVQNWPTTLNSKK